jgi:hypothetical protein
MGRDSLIRAIVLRYKRDFMHIQRIDDEVRAPFGPHSIYVADLIPFLVEGREIRPKWAFKICQHQS